MQSTAHFVRSLFLLVCSSFLAGAACITDNSDPGCVHFAMRTSSNFDQYINGSFATHSFIADHFWRMQTTPGWFNTNLPWYPRAWGYIDALAIYNNSNPLKDQHPEWIAKDIYGNSLFIAWGCSNGSCPQYAADISNQAYRDYWINQARGIAAAGYKGIWIDDVNLRLNLCKGNGTTTAPLDRATGQPMTDQAWRQYFADFMSQVRSALPDFEILHNTLWYAGSGNPGSDPAVQQEIKAANFINLERGVDDGGLTGDNGYWSIQSVFRFVDTVHSLGAKIDIQNYGFDGDYGPASYFLVSSGTDALGNDAITPSNWPSNYDVALGSPTSGRYTWNGLIRRDFTNGFVVINPPNAATVHVQVSGSFHNSAGNAVTQLDLAQRQGAILVGQASVQPPPVAPPPVVDPIQFKAGTYMVKNALSQMALDDAGQSTRTGTQMVQWSPDGADSQSWYFQADGTGAFMIQNVHSKLYLEDANGAAIQDWYGNSLSKHWIVTPVNGGYLLQNKGTGKVLDDSGASKQQGQGIITWPVNGGLNQVWSVQ